MSIIPIMIVLDGETIKNEVGTGGTIDKPIQIGDKENLCIYMMTNRSYAVANEGNSELVVRANPEDILQWRTTAIDRANYSPILVRFEASHGGNLLSPPMNVLPTLFYYIPSNPANPDGPLAQVSMTDDLWTCYVEKPGSVTYHWVFKLLDENGKTIGYYSWDPFIQVTKPGK